MADPASGGTPPKAVGGRTLIMYFVYVLQSQKHGRYYIGSTSDLDKRLARHNQGKNISTRPGIPWTLVYQEPFQTRQDAYRREMQMKCWKGGDAFKQLIAK